MKRCFLLISFFLLQKSCYGFSPAPVAQKQPSFLSYSTIGSLDDTRILAEEGTKEGTEEQGASRTEEDATDEEGISEKPERISNTTALFSGLDKITGKIRTFVIEMNKTAVFSDHLYITPEVCYTRPRTEKQKTSVFVKIAEKNTAGKLDIIFSGWMFAESPGLSGLEHAVYDVWLIACTQVAPLGTPFQVP